MPNEYELFTNNVKRFDYLQPIYHSTEKLSQEVIKTRISSAIKANALDKFEDFIPDEVLIRNDLFSRNVYRKPISNTLYYLSACFHVRRSVCHSNWRSRHASSYSSFK